MTPPTRVTFAQLLRFFLPLGAVPLLIASTHTLTDAALARLASPELMLASFAVVKGLANAIKAPELMALQLSVSLVDDRASLRSVLRFVTGLVLLFSIILIVLAFSPAGEWVLRHVIGLRDPAAIQAAITALRLVCWLPAGEAFRNAYQGLAIGLKRTVVLALGTLIRVLVLALFMGWAVATQRISGVVAASATWTLGIIMEAIFVYLYLVRNFGSLGEAAERMPQRNHQALTLMDIGKFFVPLALTVALSAWLLPIIQSGLARSDSATHALAAFGVAWGLVLLIAGPVGMLHQCALVYTTGAGDPNWGTVMRFCLLVGLGGLGMMLLLALTPLGGYFLHQIMGLPDDVAHTVRQTMVVFALLPLIRAWREAHWGVLMHRRTTSMIGVAKVANLAVVVLFLLLALEPLARQLAGGAAVAGALAYTLGEAAESVIIAMYAPNGAL